MTLPDPFCASNELIYRGLLKAQVTIRKGEPQTAVSLKLDLFWAFDAYPDESIICTWRYDEVVFQLLAVSIEDDINARINPLVGKAAKIRNVTQPSGWNVS